VLKDTFGLSLKEIPFQLKPCEDATKSKKAGKRHGKKKGQGGSLEVLAITLEDEEEQEESDGLE
jgi:hypothetical protein